MAVFPICRLYGAYVNFIDRARACTHAHKEQARERARKSYSAAGEIILRVFPLVRSLAFLARLIIVWTIPFSASERAFILYLRSRARVFVNAVAVRERERVDVCVHACVCIGESSHLSCERQMQLNESAKRNGEQRGKSRAASCGCSALARKKARVARARARVLCVFSRKNCGVRVIVGISVRVNAKECSKVNSRGLKSCAPA